jgi:V-type H+-transporting ATPase subunit a
MTQSSSVFFPEEMVCVDVIVPHDCSYHFVKSLSNANLIHFIDNNDGTRGQEKRYTDDYIRCEEAQRCLQFIEQQLRRADVLLPKPSLEEFQNEAHRHTYAY